MGESERCGRCGRRDGWCLVIAGDIGKGSEHGPAARESDARGGKAGPTSTGEVKSEAGEMVKSEEIRELSSLPERECL